MKETVVDDFSIFCILPCTLDIFFLFQFGYIGYCPGWLMAGA